jgi:hypothetical protein
MSRRVIVFGIIVLFLCSSGAPSLGSMWSGYVVMSGVTNERTDTMDIPTWYQGDVWTYTINPLYYSSPNGSFSGSIQNFRQQVVGVVGDAYRVAVTGTISGTLVIGGYTGTLSGGITGTSYLRVSDLAEKTSEIQSQGTILISYVPFPYTLSLVTTSSPALEVFDFPLAVGEQWQLEALSTTSGSFSITGLYEQSLNGSQWIDETVSCTTEESVSVPAGVFECLTVARGSTMTWYSSQVGNSVKSMVDETTGNMTVQMTQSLQSFSRAAQPLTVSEDIEPAVVAPGVSVVVSGTVTNTGTGAPVQNGVVSVVIPSTGGSWSTSTDTSGQYSLSFTAPTMLDDTPCGRETGSGGVVASCSSGGLSGYRVQTLTTVTDTAPAAPSITGPSEGKVKVIYNCTICTVDPESDDVSYSVDWGDATSSGWLGPFTSGEAATVSHTFAKKGTYTITVSVKDIYGAKGPTGTLQVTMPTSLSFPLFIRLFEWFPHAFPLLRYLLGC